MFSNVGAKALMRWYFLLSQVLVVMIHISSDTGLKVIFVLSVVIISNPQIDFAPLPDEVNSSIAVSLMLTCACVCVCVCVCVCARARACVYVHLPGRLNLSVSVGTSGNRSPMLC